MNYSTAVFLINPAVRAVMGVYEPDIPSAKPVKREIFKTLDETIAVGDLVVVPADTRWNMTVFKVTEVDVDVDFESQHKMEWIVAKIDKSGYEKTLSMEQTAIQKIRSAESRKKRDDLAKVLLADNEALRSLPIAGLRHTEELDIPTPEPRHAAPQVQRRI